MLKSLTLFEPEISAWTSENGPWTLNERLLISANILFLVFQVSSQGIALQPRGGGGRGYRSSSCPLEGIALCGGVAEIVSPIAA